MSENTVRHLIAICGTFVAIFAYMAGYISGGLGWWWTVITVSIVYWAIYKLVNVSHH